MKKMVLHSGMEAKTVAIPIFNGFFLSENSYFLDWRQEWRASPSFRSVNLAKKLLN
jgi:hypothetical protein